MNRIISMLRFPPQRKQKLLVVCVWNLSALFKVYNTQNACKPNVISENIRIILNIKSEHYFNFISIMYNVRINIMIK